MKRNSFIGVGCTSTVSALPECERDVVVCSDVMALVGHGGEIVRGAVTPLVDIAAMARLARGSRRAHVLYSGHGMSIDRQFALWLGNEANIAMWTEFVEKVVGPLCSVCDFVTLALDTCFSGKAVTRGNGTDGTYGSDGKDEVKRGAEQKGFGSLDALPAHELADSPEVKKLENLAIVTACGRNETADGQWVSMTERGWATHSTVGMSLFSRCWCEQILLARNIEWVAENNAEYAKLRNKARTVTQIARGTEAMMRGMYTHFGGPLYQGIPPRSDGPNVMVRVGRKHDGNLFGEGE